MGRKLEENKETIPRNFSEEGDFRGRPGLKMADHLSGVARDSIRSVESLSPEETFAFGEEFGRRAKPGGVIVLDGDLGVGKTVFTQGIAKGLGITEAVSSPTFTILQVYEEGRLPLYHFDVYRIGDVEEMEEVGYDDYIFGQGLSLIEWGSRIEEILPTPRTSVLIEKDLEKGFDYREITIRQIG